LKMALAPTCTQTYRNLSERLLEFDDIRLITSCVDIMVIGEDPDLPAKYIAAKRDYT
jgi:hypothetical protein